MNKKDYEKFKRFFFYGIQDKKEVKEGILCFSSSEIYKRYSLENWYDIPNQQLEEEIIQEATKKYIQFYRFVILNDTNNNDTLDVNIQDLRKELEEEMYSLKQEKKVIDTKAGVFFIREKEESLKGGQKYIYDRGLQGEEGWTKQIYDILNKLECIEKQDSEQYYKYWIFTKLARAVNRGDKEEALRVRQIYENLGEQNKGDERE